jgi:hypothetical protein
MTSGQHSPNGLHLLQSHQELYFHRDLCLTCSTKQEYYSTAGATLLAILNEQLSVFCECMESFSHTCNRLSPTHKSFNNQALSQEKHRAIISLQSKWLQISKVMVLQDVASYISKRFQNNDTLMFVNISNCNPEVEKIML